MFQFRAFPSYTYLIQCMILRYCLSVFPHSEISGSSLICSSPKLIAACRVLHRLLMPRHSPCALFSLTFRKCSHLRLVLLNYAGLQQKMSHKIVFTHFRNKPSGLSRLKSSTMLFLTLRVPAQRPLLPCFSFPLFSFQGASEGYTLKIEQCKRPPDGVQNV